MALNGSVQHCFTRAPQGQAQCPGGHMFLQVWNPFASLAVVFSQQGWSNPTGPGAALAPAPSAPCLFSYT